MEHHHTASTHTISAFMPLLIVAGVLIIYLVAVIRQHRLGYSWSKWRTTSCVAGVALLAVAMLPSVVNYAHYNIKGHMVQHLLIGMLAPLGLVLAAPVTLALRTLPVKTARFVTAILRSKLFHWLSHPVTALVLNIGGMYLLYLTPLYSMTLTQPYLHHLVHIHFLAAGYLFVWAIAGPDPAPDRPGIRTRLVVLFISIATHAYLSKFMYAYVWPRNTPHDVEQIRSAAKLMYYGGDLSELLLAVALFAMWYKKSSRYTICVQK
ncbi:cytochrome c oxidase assembly protein [Pontibacter silvestris]|uniref:Cytochrome c oxidase assembly protein n=1 Tax=Pontibacter silvestris TaxID=2305183 RepID=A0ABW4X2F8_9BACT|nr:cytochrome c oxidase assembly protein [Pontibacter silvestris]MCC9135892.1 cytochrome c oxidase assembly protein [Pontibacter silvestris]